MKANKTSDSTSVIDLSIRPTGSAARAFSPKEMHTPGPTMAQASDVSFAGKGEMSALMGNYDWSSHPLGPVSSWPQSLRTAVSICLESRFPILVWWGSELFMLYNDAYSRILGAKHPGALGQPGADCWPETWDVISKMLEGVLKKGEAAWSEDQLILVDRNGYVEECYFTFSYSPIRDESGDVGGVFTAVTETTERVLGERRLTVLQQLGAASVQNKAAEEACQSAASVLSRYSCDIPFGLIYLAEANRSTARLVACFGLDPDPGVAPQNISLQKSETSPWPVLEALAANQPLVLAKLSGNLANLPGGPWPEHAHSAVVLPIASAGEGYATGVLIAGISPRRAFDEQYRAFFGLVARNLAGAIADVRGYEDQQKRSAVEHQLRSEAELERRWLRESFILAPAGMALLRDPDHRFTFVNSAYLELIGRENDEVIGKTVTEVFPEIKGQGYLELLNRVYETAEPFVATEKELRLKRRGMDEDVVYITFSYQAMTNVAEQVEGILVHAIDVTEQVLARSLLETRVKERTADLQEAEQKLRALNSKLLQTQDDERRRLARDLHDSAGQILVALKMNLFPLEQELAMEHPSLSKVAAGSIELVDDLSKELRTMSHLLHPPLLDEAGLPSAIRWYVEGFAERSGIDVKLKLDPGMPRLSQECETAIFRIVQECLTNIHRHSGSTTASVSVDHSSGRTRVEIADAGSGIPHFDATKKAPKRVGMGIQGMQERVRQLQGQIEIRSGNSGTSVVVILPRQEVSA